jgi:thioredoxin-related protein
MKKLILLLLLAFTTGAFAQNWQTDMETAKTLAAKENKNIILVFSGSDWCAPCIKLDKEIWQSEAFKAEAEKSWILVRADFPKKKQNILPEDQKRHNDKLAQRYNEYGDFPLVVLMDKDGRQMGKTGYKNLPPDQYIALLHSLEKKSK